MKNSRGIRGCIGMWLLMGGMAVNPAAFGQDAYEPDDDFEAASTIGNGDIQNRSIHVVGDVDWATFTVGAEGIRNLIIASSFDTELYLYRYVAGEGHYEVGYDEPNGPGDDSVITIASVDAGVYSIRVMERGNNGTLAGYQLTAQWEVPVAADAYEPDNTARTAKSIDSGAAQNRSIHVVGDVDLAKFTLGGAGAVNVRITASDGTHLWLIRGGTGEIIGFDQTNGSGFDSSIFVSTLAAGTYYIKVKEFGNDGVMTYQLSAVWEEAAINPDAYERDNVRASAKLVRNGQTQRRTIHVAGNRDWARFSIGGQGARDLLIQTAGPAGDTQMWLYDGLTGARLRFDDDSGPGRFSRITAPLIMPGTYFLRIQEKGNNGTIPLYSLKVRWTAR